MCNIPHCCPPKESGPCLSPCLADHPLRPATRRRLGRPLPHQQADRPQAHPEARCRFREPARRPVSTSGISAPFDALFPTSGQVAYVLLNRSPLHGLPKEPAPLDLHTLGTPQAFVLSQDQTLQRKSVSPPAPEGERKEHRFREPLPTAKLVLALSPLFSFQGSPAGEAALWPASPIDTHSIPKTLTGVNAFCKHLFAKELSSPAHRPGDRGEYSTAFHRCQHSSSSVLHH